jgi:hypothetical protein
MALVAWRMGEPIDNGVSFWCQALSLKKSLGRATPAPKVVFIGASNVVYGIQAGRVEQALGERAVNVGLFASLGADIVVDTGKAVSRPGDTAVLSLEHFFFEDKDYNGPFIRSALVACDTDALFAMPIAVVAKTLILQPVLETIEASARKAAHLAGLHSLFSPPLDYKLGANPSFNRWGDFTQNADDQVPLGMREWVRDHPGGLTIDFSEASPGARAVRNFVLWARANDVKVFAAWPAVYWPRRDLAAPGLQKIKAYYQSLGVPVLGEPEDMMGPLTDFFDTNNHLTAEAAARRSLMLASALREQLAAKPAERRRDPP